MSKTKTIAIIALSLLCATTQAQTTTMSEVFKQMPDSLLPALSHNNRLDMIDFIDSKMEANVKNNFDEQSQLAILTDRFLHLDISQSSWVEMRLLKPSATLPDSSDAVVCMVQTFGGEEGESTVEFFTAKWKRLALPDPIAPTLQCLTVRPDTMNNERYAELTALTDHLMAVAKLSQSEETLTLNGSAAMLSAEDRQKVKPIMQEKVLNWDGEKFK